MSVWRASLSIVMASHMGVHSTSPPKSADMIDITRFPSIVPRSVISCTHIVKMLTPVLLAAYSSLYIMARLTSLLFMLATSILALASSSTTSSTEIVPKFPHEGRSVAETLKPNCNDGCAQRGTDCIDYCLTEHGRSPEAWPCFHRCSAASVACGSQVSCALHEYS